MTGATGAARPGRAHGAGSARAPASGAAAAPPADRHFVTALARGLELLRVFGEGADSLTNADLSERCGLPKATVSRLTYTLTRLGYLAQSPTTGRYRLAPGVLALGYALLSGLDIRERARPLLQRLATTADATVAVGGRDRLSVVYLDCFRGTGTVTLSLDVGSRVPLATTAIGRALLAGLPAAERAYLLDLWEARDAAGIDAIRAGVDRACVELDAQGFCTSFGDWQRDVNAVGAPVPTADGLFAINCGGPAFKLPRDRLQDTLGPALASIARELATHPA